MPAFENRRRSPSRTRASARNVRRSKAETTSIFVAASERPGSSHILRHWTVCRLSVTLSSPPMNESRHVVSNVASRSTVWYAHDSESVVPIACTFLRSLTTGEMDEVTRMGSPPGSARPTFSTSSPALAAGADPGSATRPRSATDATSAAVAIPPVPKPRDGCARPRHVGGPASSAAFCLGVQPELRALDAELAQHGGVARASTDDGYAVGPAAVVFPAVARFVEQVKISVGLDVQSRKCSCFSHTLDLSECPHRATARSSWAGESGLPVGELEAIGVGLVDFVRRGYRDGPDLRAAVPTRRVRGVMVAGVPFTQRPEDAAEVMTDKLVEAVSNIHNAFSADLLQPEPMALWTLVYHSYASVFDYWLQLMPPRDVADHARQLDLVLDEARRVAFDDVGADLLSPEERDLVMLRVQLPHREHGCGLRSRSWVSRMAFAGSLASVASTFLDGAAGVRGFFPSLVQTFGDGAFEVGGHRFARFLDPERVDADARLVTPRALRDAWRSMRDEHGQAHYGDEPSSGPLALQAIDAGRSGERRLQRALTRQMERARATVVQQRMMRLPADSEVRRAWLDVDIFSHQFLAQWPTPELRLDARDFREEATSYLGLRSPEAHRLILSGRTHIPGGGRAGVRVLDPYAHQAELATLTGDSWRVQHDACTSPATPPRVAHCASGLLCPTRRVRPCPTRWVRRNSGSGIGSQSWCHCSVAQQCALDGCWSGAERRAEGWMPHGQAARTATWASRLRKAAASFGGSCAAKSRRVTRQQPTGKGPHGPVRARRLVVPAGAAHRHAGRACVCVETRSCMQRHRGRVGVHAPFLVEDPAHYSAVRAPAPRAIPHAPHTRGLAREVSGSGGIKLRDTWPGRDRASVTVRLPVCKSLVKAKKK